MRPSPEWALTGTSGWWPRYKERMLRGAAGPPAYLTPFLHFFLSTLPPPFLHCGQWVLVSIHACTSGDQRRTSGGILPCHSPTDHPEMGPLAAPRAPDFSFSDKLTGRSASPQDSLVPSMSSTSFRSSCDHVSLHMVGSGHLTSGPDACTARFLPYLFSPTKSDLERDVRRQL